MAEQAVIHTTVPAARELPPLVILVATDGSADAVIARNAALDLTTPTRWPLHLVHAWEPPVPLPYLGYLASGDPGAYRDQATSVLADERRRVEGQGSFVSGDHLVEGAAADTVLRVADEVGAGLVVIGSRGLGLLGRVAMGTLSEEVVRHSHRPVLLTRGGSDAWPPSHVLAADDGSPAAANAARLAGVLARVLEVPVVLIQVQSHLDDVAASASGMSIDTVLAGAGVALGERAEEVRRLTGATVRTRLAFGSAVEGILDASTLDGPHPLLACGSRGTGLRQRLRVGSVSRRLLHASHTPILVAPWRPAAR